MVVRVKRKRTKLIQPREPWSIREISPTGPPRTLLTNCNFPCFIKFGGSTFRPGRIDPLLRLYQHWGIQKNGPFKEVDGTTYVVYDAQEWQQVEEWADWIELVRETKVWRVQKNEIKRQRNQGFAEVGTYIPLSAFQEVVRSG